MVGNVANFKRRFSKTIPNALRKAAASGLEEAATIIVLAMQRRAPKDELKLVNSIGWTWGAAPAGSLVLGQVGSTEYKTLRITIYAGDSTTVVTNSRGVEFQNAFIQEFGTENMPANAFFYPTWRGEKRKARARVTRKISAAIKKL